MSYICAHLNHGCLFLVPLIRAIEPDRVVCELESSRVRAGKKVRNDLDSSFKPS